MESPEDCKECKHCVKQYIFLFLLLKISRLSIYSRVHFGRYRVSHKRKKSWITMLMLLIKLLKISINLLINWINWYNKSLLCIEWFLMYVNRELNRERTYCRFDYYTLRWVRISVCHILVNLRNWETVRQHFIHLAWF